MKTLRWHDIEVRLTDILDPTNVVAVLPQAQVQGMSWVLNNYGQMSFAQSTYSPGADEATRLRELEAQVWYDDDLVWWGQTVSESGGPGQQQIGCDGLFSYFEDRIIDDRTMEWLSTEQFVIASDLILYAQSEVYQANRNMHIGVDISSPSGKVRTLRFIRSEHAVISDLIRDLTMASDGFDFDILIDPSGTRTWTPYYPEKGIVRNDIMLDYGKNVTAYSYNKTTVDMGTQTYCTGGAVPNSEEGRMEQVYEDVAASAKYKVIQRVVSEGSQMDPTWLLDKATQDVLSRNKPKVVPSVTAVATPDMEMFGVVETGDWLPLRIIDGFREVEGLFRVGNIQWQPDDTLAFGFVDQVLA